MDKIQRLQEGWVKFTRYQCKEGFIDRWSGSSSDDPNRETESQVSVSMITFSYRLNGVGEWVDRFYFRGLQEFLQYRKDFTAQEIWEESILK